MSAVRRVAEVDPTSAAAVRALAEAATAADGREPLSEQFVINLNGRARPRVAHLLAEEDGTVVGYAQRDRDAAELAVHPDHRGRGVGAALLEGLLGIGPTLDVWAHGDLPAAAALAASHGLTRNRVLLQMRRTGGALPELVVPEGITIRPFVVGQDEDEFLRVNNAAFDWHPEQGGWTTAQVTEREGESWFDPAGFLLAEDEQGTLLGYHWTKVHHETDPVMGEVYVLGVDPAAHGRGLGRVLTLAGLHHLAERGLDTVLLYVESDNAPAVRVYEKLGFVVHTSDVMYHRG
ncbi:mycothiol synthase [Pseudonocardia sp. WMMC193]|uniref:mycothiol synthase n=1 Tax=Pseudonocardia sp. WMMC193 TaxID=2911965 RepID=UPI001F03054B|nr:mycothiol synthase [Pseudonocardia sp. WMMC193]MCF7551568.1 mycothiol synthase [Pseudonocardia sp. WMMC193]